jgi:hypothetical protein
MAPFTQERASAADPTLSVTPVTRLIQLTTSTTISINAADTENLNAFDVTITYNPAIITLEGWSYGTLLSNLSTVLVSNNTTTGSLRVVATQTNTPGVTGSGVLLNLVFRGIAVGSSPITITQARFSSAAIPPVSSYPTRVNGTLDVEYGPTAIDLLSFNLTGTNRSITLAWQTATETDNLGFNIYRATSTTGQRTLLTTNLIPSGSHPGSLLGAQYTFTDTPVDVNCVYYYWLESLDIHGKTKLGGPWSYEIVAPQIQTHLRIQPYHHTIPANGETSVSVSVKDGHDVNAFDLKIIYDANVISLESWSYGSFLSNLTLATIVDTPGMLHLVASQANTPSVSGDGTLLILVFRGIRQGSTTLTIIEPQLMGATPETSFAPLIDIGSISVTTPTATPPPSLTPAPTKTATYNQGSVPTYSSPAVTTGITGSTNPLDQNRPAALVPDQGLSTGQMDITSPLTHLVPDQELESSGGELNSTSQDNAKNMDLGQVNNLLWGAVILLLTALTAILIHSRKTPKKENPNGD